ncbi:hypothetical protein HDU82_008732 [Entophlyctis luteolus]|nr:hypothetical protein HDU82_008732 [Entophlyctis luteolus]
MKLVSLLLALAAAGPAVCGGSAAAAASGPIKNFVVLCLENHSFDALLGWWAKGVPGMDGIPPQPAACNTLTKTGQQFCATNSGKYVQRFDPDHAVDATTLQIYGLNAGNSTAPVGVPNMSGFVDQAAATEDDPTANMEPSGLNETIAAQTVMSSFDPADIPVTIALAENFLVFDAWHAAVPGPTFPNRVSLMSATSHGLYYNEVSQLLAGMPQKSLFQMFDDAGYSYKNYYNQVPTGLVFRDFRDRVAKDIAELSPAKHVGSLNSFFADAAAGSLPAFSWIDPILLSLPGVPANDNHPPHDIARGELLVKQVYEALRASPQWESTALLLTYDEHGGFWDHVPPPVNIPIPDAASAACADFHFDRAGVRVPTVLISPHVAKGFVHQPSAAAPAAFADYSASIYEHASLVRTLNELFDLKANITARAQWAGSFAGLFNSSARSDTPETLPSPPPITIANEIADTENEWSEVVMLIQSLL